MRLGPWRQGRQLLQQFERLEEQMRRAVAPGLPQLDQDAPVGAASEPLLGQRRPQHVAAEPLESGPVAAGHPHIGMEVEAVQLDLAGAARGGDGAARVLAQPAHAPARAGSERDSPEHRGAGHAGQGGRFLGERIRRSGLAGMGIESAARQEPTQAATHRGQEVAHLLVGGRRGVDFQKVGTLSG